MEQFPEDEICLLSQDNYYRPIEHQTKDHNGIENFDLPGAIDDEAFATDVEKLRSGEVVTRPEYTFNNSTKVPDLLHFHPRKILVVEGIFVFHFPEVAKLLDLKINNSSIIKTINLKYIGNTPQTSISSINLSDVSADFKANNPDINTLRFKVDATITGTDNEIQDNEKLSLEMNLTNLKFKNITGYFGQQKLASFTDSLLLKVFEKPTDGFLSFTNPKLKFIVDNSFGIPIRLNFNKLATVDELTHQSSNIDFTNPKDISVPNSIGSPPVSTILDLNNATTNNTMTNLVNVSPKYLKYDISAESNPGVLGSVKPVNFIESTSRMIVKVGLELPFEGYASGMTVKDTLDFSLDQNIKNIKSVLFRLKVDNGLPLSLNGQAEFVDKNYKHLFNLFDKNTQIISAAPVNSDGIAKSQISKSTDIVITENKTLLLDQVKYIIISGITETTQPSKTVVKLQDTNKIGLKLSVQVQLKGK